MATTMTKPERKLSWDRNACTLTLSMPRAGRSRPEVTSYRVEEFDVDFGRGFGLTKIGANGEPVETYCVNTLGHCDCIDHQRNSNFCKHLAAVSKLLERGLIGGA